VAIKAIAELLAAQAALKIFVVGHTDNVGTLASNLTLSRQRAEAVVAALVANHGVAPSRLVADGVGPLAPVAPNDSEEGRQKNRRVEIVAQ
jgi:OOP family OmpA-OmpF porin